MHTTPPLLAATDRLPIRRCPLDTRPVELGVPFDIRAVSPRPTGLQEAAWPTAAVVVAVGQPDRVL